MLPFFWVLMDHRIVLLQTCITDDASRQFCRHVHRIYEYSVTWAATLVTASWFVTRKLGVSSNQQSVIFTVQAYFAQRCAEKDKSHNRTSIVVNFSVSSTPDNQLSLSDARGPE